MINKKNWGLIKKYLDDRLHVDQISMGSLKLEQSYIRYLLEWADEHSFAEAPSISPTFPEYMRSARLDGKSYPSSPAHIKRRAGRVGLDLPEHAGLLGSLRQVLLRLSLPGWQHP